MQREKAIPVMTPLRNPIIQLLTNLLLLLALRSWLRISILGFSNTIQAALRVILLSLIDFRL